MLPAKLSLTSWEVAHNKRLRLMSATTPAAVRVQCCRRSISLNKGRLSEAAYSPSNVAKWRIAVATVGLVNVRYRSLTA